MTFHILRLGIESQKRWSDLNYALNNYRGTSRDPLEYPIEAYDIDHPVNTTLSSFLYQDISNIDEALNNFEIIRKYMPHVEIELVACCRANDNDAIEHDLLGYDISINCGPSILWEFLAPEGDIDESKHPLMKLCYDYFFSRLNNNGLFYSSEDADWFLNCMFVINDMQKNMFDHGSFMSEFEVVAVYSLKRL